ncbi:MAG: ABC transporter permease [Chloroflexi bacterium]|nr:ABC transporter permease [Chloroflexota bacterium]
MGKYILRRLMLLFPTLVGMSMLIFLMVRLMPADIVDALVGVDPTITSEAKAALRHSFGLDDPIPIQYMKWLGDIAQGNLGKSFRTREPITQKLVQALPITLELAFLAIVMSVIVAIPLGVLSALKRNSNIDFWSRVAGLIGLAFPNFWLATMFLLFTSLLFHWVPPVIWIPPTNDLGGNLIQMFFPALALSVQLMAVEMRMSRASMLEVLRQDYIRTARAKGLREAAVVFKHALKNAFIPVATVIGIQMGALMGGSVIIEQIFGLPGVGWMLLQGIFGRDYPVVQVTALFLATVFIVVNLLVDVTYAYLDPRIKYS